MTSPHEPRAPHDSVNQTQQPLHAAPSVQQTTPVQPVQTPAPTRSDQPTQRIQPVQQPTSMDANPPIQPTNRQERPKWIIPTIIGVLAAIIIGLVIFLVITLQSGNTSHDEAQTQSSTSSNASSLPSSSSQSSSDSSNNATNNNDQAAQGDNEFSTITATINADTTASVNVIKSKLAEAEGKLGTTYDSYVANKAALGEWLNFTNAESRRLYVKIGDNTVKYYQLLSQRAAADNHLDGEAIAEELYDDVYDGALDDYYDDIYDGLFADIYEKYYDGVLDDAPDSVSYSELSDIRSETYKMISDARSDFYSDLSDMRSDFYKLYSNVHGDLWNDKYDFSSDIERFQKKIAAFKE